MKIILTESQFKRVILKESMFGSLSGPMAASLHSTNKRDSHNSRHHHRHHNMDSDNKDVRHLNSLHDVANHFYGLDFDELNGDEKEHILDIYNDYKDIENLDLMSQKREMEKNHWDRFDDDLYKKYLRTNRPLKESYDNFFNDYCVDCIKDALGRKYSGLVDIVVKALDGGLDIDDFGITEVLDILRSLGNFQMYDIFGIAPKIVKCVEVCKEGEPKYVKPTVDRYIVVHK